MQETKRLYRSRTDRKLCGVCAGIANYLNIDPTVIRLITVLIGVCTIGSMLLAYIILALIIPEEPF